MGTLFKKLARLSLAFIAFSGSLAEASYERKARRTGVADVARLRSPCELAEPNFGTLDPWRRRATNILQGVARVIE